MCLAADRDTGRLLQDRERLQSRCIESDVEVLPGPRREAFDPVRWFRLARAEMASFLTGADNYDCTLGRTNWRNVR